MMGSTLAAVQQVSIVKTIATLHLGKYKSSYQPSAYISVRVVLSFQNRKISVSNPSYSDKLKKKILKFIHPPLRISALKAKSTNLAMDRLVHRILEEAQKGLQSKIDELDGQDLDKLAKIHVERAANRLNEKIWTIAYEDIVQTLKHHPQLTLEDVQKAWKEAQVTGVIEA